MPWSAQVPDGGSAAVPEDTARELLRYAWSYIEKLVEHAQRLAGAGERTLIAWSQ